MGRFQPQILIPTGTRPSDVEVADLNGDGIPDLIFSNYADDNRLPWSWATATAHSRHRLSTPPTRAPASPDRREIAVADLNGDGIPDLIYADYVSGNVAVRLGNGDGTFGPEETFPTAAGSHAVSVTDLNGDGKPDLVVVDAVADDVSVLLGNGDGTFQPEKLYKVGVNPYSIAVAALQRRRQSRHRHVQPGRQHGQRAAGQRRRHLRAPGDLPHRRKTPRSVAVGDLTGDGQVDIVTANLGDDTASVLLGKGDGTFILGPQQNRPCSRTSSPFQVVVADLTGDGIPDIITADRPANSVSVLLGNRDGSYQTKETYATGQGRFR